MIWLLKAVSWVKVMLFLWNKDLLWHLKTKRRRNFKLILFCFSAPRTKLKFRRQPIRRITSTRSSPTHLVSLALQNTTPARRHSDMSMTVLRFHYALLKQIGLLFSKLEFAFAWIDLLTTSPPVWMLAREIIYELKFFFFYFFKRSFYTNIRVISLRICQKAGATFSSKLCCFHIF